MVCGNLSADNLHRQSAEVALTSLRSSHPSEFMLGLLSLLRESINPSTRVFAAVILRQNLLVNSSSQVWEQCSTEVHRQVQAGLLFIFQHEPSPMLRRKIADAIAATATRISGITRPDYSTDASGVSRAAKQVLEEQPKPEQLTPWPELMPTVMQLAQANVEETRESLCSLIDKSGTHITHSHKYDHRPKCACVADSDPCSLF